MIAVLLAIVGWGIAFTRPHDTIQLGTWYNMPSGSTTCPIGRPQPGGFTPCELMGNESYRGVIVNDGPMTVNVFLSVGCVIPSNTLGASLNLQYANYTGLGHTNTTNFVDISASTTSDIRIDNPAGFPCPGILTSTNVVTLSKGAGANTGWIFRVIGSGGGGIGDNPRFSFVSVVLRFTGGAGAITPTPQSITPTSFLAVIRTFPPLTTTLTENFDWIATNNTLTQGGTGNCSVPANGFLCSTTITFPTAFLSTPFVTLTTLNSPPALIQPLGTLTLLSAPTVTV